MGRKKQGNAGNQSGRWRFLRKTGKVFSCFLTIIGGVFLIALILSFTDLPYLAYHRLGTSGASFDQPPETIVILSGSGMPSPDGLMRLWHGAEAASLYPAATVILAHPYTEGDSLRALRMMARELILKGIDSTRLRFEPRGYNTHSQAVNIAARFPLSTDTSSIVLITSPEHLFRSLKTFRKAGYLRVGGLAAFDKPIDPGMAADSDKTDDIRVKSLNLRYNMWSYLNYELIVLREYLAIGYYWMKGWI